MNARRRQHLLVVIRHVLRLWGAAGRGGLGPGPACTVVVARTLLRVVRPALAPGPAADTEGKDVVPDVLPRHGLPSVGRTAPAVFRPLPS